MTDDTAATAHARTTILFDARNVWRIGLVAAALIALFAVVRFVLDAGSSLLFVVFTAWFVSLAMEPAVSRLARRMPRGVATGVVLLGVIAFFALFSALFGNLVVQQVTTLVEAIPSLVEQALDFVDQQFGVRYSLDDLLAQVQQNASGAANIAGTVAGGILSFVGALAGAVGTFFIFALLLFYLSADGPRLRRWIASLFPPRAQEATLVVWDTMAEKTGRYVGARLLLATVNATLSAIVFGIIGLPSWLALALWTGIVAQAIPAIGTYVSIALPVLVGALSPNPWLGLIVLAWGILYQQVENLTIEPRISSRAVNVHPAVSFGSVVLGTAMFGIGGALLAIPVVAMLLTLLDVYRTRYELVPELAEPGAAADGPGRAAEGAVGRGEDDKTDVPEDSVRSRSDDDGADDDGADDDGRGTAAGTAAVPGGDS